MCKSASHLIWKQATDFNIHQFTKHKFSEWIRGIREPTNPTSAPEKQVHKLWKLISWFILPNRYPVGNITAGIILQYYIFVL